MKFSIKTNDNILGLGRILGYQLLRESGGETSFTRSFGRSGYPRLHFYVRREGENLIFNLHLDQKKPSYEGSHAHAGEYDGELVEQEAERIKKILEKPNRASNSGIQIPW